MLMNNDGFSSPVSIAIAIASLVGSAIGVTRAAAIRLLFVYITDRGGVSFVIAGSASVHEW
jgi:hypothetical protein